MSNYLPFDGFRWLKRDKIDALDVNTIRKDNPEGYILEADLEFPEELNIYTIIIF